MLKSQGNLVKKNRTGKMKNTVARNTALCGFSQETLARFVFENGGVAKHVRSVQRYRYGNQFSLAVVVGTAGAQGRRIFGDIQLSRSDCIHRDSLESLFNPPKRARIKQSKQHG